jgi:hypothetical protein
VKDDERLRRFLDQVSRALVRSPEDVRVEVHDGRRATRFTVHVADEDRGQLIGKEGMTVRSLRTLAAISGHRKRRRFEIEIPD